MFGFIWKIFLELLTSIIIVFNHGKCVSLSNQKCTTQPALINLHSNEYTQGLCCYLFVVNLDWCVSSKTGDLNLGIFNMITAQHE